MTEPRNEKQLTNRIVAEIKKLWPSAWVLKVHGGGYQRSGVPDLLISVRDRLVGLEVKHQKPGETHEKMLRRVSAPQWAEIKGLQLSGAEAAVVSSVDEAVSVVQKAAGVVSGS